MQTTNEIRRNLNKMANSILNRDCNSCKFQFTSFGLEICTHYKAQYTVETQINGIKRNKGGQHSCSHMIKEKGNCGPTYSLFIREEKE